MFLEFLNLRIIIRTILAESKRINVKLPASIALLLSARRHNTEFAAKAIRANEV
jgi:hypothetical protein